MGGEAMNPTLEQVQQAARKFSSYATLANPDEKALHTYTDTAGNPLYWRIRLKNTGTGEKWIRPFHFDGQQFQPGEPPKPEAGKPLYGLHLLTIRPDALAWIVEGEKAADALNKAFKAWEVDMQHVATTSGGMSSASGTDWTPLAGQCVVMWPDNDEAGAKYAAEVCKCLQGIAAEVATLDIEPLALPAKGDAFDWLQRDDASLDALLEVLDLSWHSTAPEMQLESIGQVLEAIKHPVIYRRLSDVKAEPISWLWQGRIARGKVSMIAGNPGLGKSQLTCAMAAVVTTGGCWPVDHSPCDIGNVVFVSGEDDAADTIRPRLEAAGADISRCFILDMVRDVDRDGGQRQRSFSLQSDIPALAAMLAEIGGAALVVIDPISAYLGGTDSHKNADVRALLDPLGKFASQWNAAVVCVSHLNKGGGNGEALARVTGSLAFVAAARAVFVVVKDKEDERRRLFLTAKNNIGNDSEGLAYQVRGVTLDNGICTSWVKWEAEPVTISADEAMRAPMQDDDGGTLADAKQFLQGLLADGALPTKAIKADADGAGYSWSTIRRAQKELGIEAVKEGMKGGWVWKLPHVELRRCSTTTEDAQQNNVSTFGNAPAENSSNVELI